jgi:hypothetical protein
MGGLFARPARAGKIESAPRAPDRAGVTSQFELAEHGVKEPHAGRERYSMSESAGDAKPSEGHIEAA